MGAIPLAEIYLIPPFWGRGIRARQFLDTIIRLTGESLMRLDVNEQYYNTLKPGRRDYWRYMAAPLVRVETIMSILASAPPISVVDLGCGDGELLSEVAARFPNTRLTGIDRSFPQIEENRKGNPSVSWYAMDLDSIGPLNPGMRGGFDVVLSLEVIEHVSSPNRLLSHAFELSQPGGRLILSTQSGPLRETEKRVGHKRHFSVAEMNELLKSNGWRPVRVWNNGWPFHNFSKWGANLFPERSMRQFGEEAYTWSQKFFCKCLRRVFKFNSNSRGAQLFAVAEKP
jgi:SAM-dependent methyltransferase